MICMIGTRTSGGRNLTPAMIPCMGLVPYVLVELSDGLQTAVEGEGCARKFLHWSAAPIRRQRVCKRDLVPKDAKATTNLL